jgi:hypothetical protein
MSQRANVTESRNDVGTGSGTCRVQASKPPSLHMRVCSLHIATVQCAHPAWHGVPSVKFCVGSLMRACGLRAAAWSRTASDTPE